MPSTVGSCTCVQTNHGRSVNANMTYNGSFSTGDSKHGVIGSAVNDGQKACFFRARLRQGKRKSLQEGRKMQTVATLEPARPHQERAEAISPGSSLADEKPTVSVARLGAIHTLRQQFIRADA